MRGNMGFCTHGNTSIVSKVFSAYRCLVYPLWRPPRKREASKPTTTTLVVFPTTWYNLRVSAQRGTDGIMFAPGPCVRLLAFNHCSSGHQPSYRQPLYPPPVYRLSSPPLKSKDDYDVPPPLRGTIVNRTKYFVKKKNIYVRVSLYRGPYSI